MGVLARFERRLGGAVEGGFAKVFRSRVEPVELAVALKRECDDEKSIGPVKTLVPNDFVVDLGPADHDRLAPYILTLGDELAEMVREHASEQGYSFLGPVAVTFHRDESLSTGSYRVGSRVEAGDEPAQPFTPVVHRPSPLAPPSAPAAPVPAPAAAPLAERTEALPRVAPPRSPGSLELPDGTRVPLTDRGAVIGRGQEAQVRLADASVSRRHAEITVEDGRVRVTDLGSTNGTTRNGERITSAWLTDGDRITVGAATITYRS